MSNYRAAIAHSHQHKEESARPAHLPFLQALETPVRTSRTRELPFRFDVRVALLRGADPAARHGFHTERGLAASSHGGECGVAFGRPPKSRVCSFTPLILGERGPPRLVTRESGPFRQESGAFGPWSFLREGGRSKRASKRTWKVGPITEYESSSWELTCSYITLKFTKHLPSMI